MRSEIIRNPLSPFRPRFADGVLLAFLLTLTILSLKLIPSGVVGSSLTVKTSDTVYEISLEDEGVHTIEGPLGEAALVVRDGEARLRNAPCPLKICEAMGPISRSGEVILCLPNRIYIRVVGREEVDAVSR